MAARSTHRPRAPASKSWLVVARGASARLQLVGHLGWVHRLEARPGGAAPRAHGRPARAEDGGPRSAACARKSQGRRGGVEPRYPRRCVGDCVTGQPVAAPGRQTRHTDAEAHSQPLDVLPERTVRSGKLLGTRKRPTGTTTSRARSCRCRAGRACRGSTPWVSAQVADGEELEDALLDLVHS